VEPETVLFGVAFAIFLLGILVEFLLRELLRKRYPDQWRAVGAPSLFTNNSWRSNRRLNTWLKSAEARQLSDSYLQGMLIARRMLSWIYFPILIVLGAMIVAQL